MSLTSDQPPAAHRLDATVATRALIRCVLLAMLGTALVIALLLLVMGRGDWWQGFGAATLLSALAAAVSITAMRVGIGFGVQGAIAGHFAGAGLRLLVVLGGGLLLVGVGKYPAAPTLLLAVPYYFATLGAEVVCLARLYWNQDDGSR